MRHVVRHRDYLFPDAGDGLTECVKASLGKLVEKKLLERVHQPHTNKPGRPKGDLYRIVDQIDITPREEGAGPDSLCRSPERISSSEDESGCPTPLKLYAQRENNSPTPESLRERD